MTDEQKAREIQASIARVLMEDWDPIGVREEPDVANEYDAYVGGVYRLLASGANTQQIAEHLAAVERDRMGLANPSVDALLPVAEKLTQLDTHLRTPRQAI